MLIEDIQKPGKHLMGWNLGTWDASAPAILGQSLRPPLEWEFGAGEISGDGTGSPQQQTTAGSLILSF